MRSPQSQLSQPFYTAEVLQPPDHPCCPPPDLFQEFHAFLVLSCTSRAGCSWRWDLTRVEVEKNPPLSQPAGHTSFDTDQDTDGFLGCKCMVLIHSELFVYQCPQVLLHGAALNLFSASLCWCWGLLQPRWGTWLLALLNFMGLLLKEPKSRRSSDSVGPDDIFYFLFLMFYCARHLYSCWLVGVMVQEWKQAIYCWITVSSAKAEVLLLKVIISDMDHILHYLPVSQTQASGETERCAQGALTGEPGSRTGQIPCFSGNWTQNSPRCPRSPPFSAYCTADWAFPIVLVVSWSCQT